MKPVLYKISLMTNMHVGSGEVNYSVIDKEVERDAVLGEATIHASGVKGALKDYCRGDQTYKGRILEIFGDDIKTDSETEIEIEAGHATTKKRATSPGAYKFFSAQLLARPLRVSSGNLSFVLATTRELLAYFVSLSQGVGIKVADAPELIYEPGTPPFVSSLRNIVVEGKPVVNLRPQDELWAKLAEKLIGKPAVIADSLKEYDLPVIARNCLNEQGLSKNLWYEEYVPHQSRFFFIILTPDGKDPLDFTDYVQFGGNASIGCGYARVTRMAFGWDEAGVGGMNNAKDADRNANWE